MFARSARLSASGWSKTALWGPFALRITGENPADGQGGKACTIPQSRSRADLHRAFSLPIPLQSQTLPRGLRIDQDLFERREARANHARTTDRVCVAFGGWFMQDRIQMKRSDEAHLLLLALQAQFQDAI